MSYVDLSEQVKSVRKAAGLTQTDFADKLGVHPQTVSKWERGKTAPDVSQLGDIADVCGVTLEKLLDMPADGQVFGGRFDMQSMCAKIAELRRSASESQNEIADVCNSSPDAVSRWERGLSCPDVSELCAIARHYGKNVSEVYYGVCEVGKNVEQVRVRPSGSFRRWMWALVAVCLVCVVVVTVVVGVISPETTVYYVVTANGVSHKVASGQAFVPPQVTKDGYMLVGWVDDSGQNVSFPVTVRRNMSYSPVFTPCSYNIDYWLNGGDFIETPDYAFTVECDGRTLPVPTKSGTEFVGWYDTPDYSGEPLTCLEKRCGDLSLYARWDDGVCSVRYVLSGGAMQVGNPTEINEESSTKLAEPVRVGYTFVGWFDGPDGGREYTEVGGENCANLVLYAIWQKNEVVYNIEYVTDGGVNSALNPSSVRPDDIVKLSPATKVGYNFVGWFETPDGTGMAVEYLYNTDGDVKLYAVYTPRTFVVLYELCGGRYLSDKTNPNKITYGQSVDLLPVAKYGFDFVGWFDSPSGGKVVSTIDSTNVTEISTLYAVFEEKTFAVTLDAKGGSFSYGGALLTRQTFMVKFYDEFVLPTATLAGYVFDGWATADGTIVEKINSVNITEMTLTARWHPYRSSYNVTYDLDGGTLTASNPAEIGVDEVIMFNEPRKPGYLFLGWYDEYGKRYVQSPKGNIEDLSLRAKWQAVYPTVNEDNVSYMLGDDYAAIVSVKYSSGDSVILPDYLGGKPVKILHYAFENAKLRSLVLPDSLEEIDKGAFCKAVIEQPLVIPRNVVRIGANSFEDFVGGLTFDPDCRIEVISQDAFFCAKISNVLVLPSTVKTLENRAFYWMATPGLVLNEGLTYIGDDAIGILGGVSVYLPSTVKSCTAPDNKVVASSANKYLTDYDFASSHKVRLHDGDNVSVVEGEYVVLPAPEKAGYRFAGWKTVDGEYVQSVCIPSEDVDLYAVWVERNSTDGMAATTPLRLSDGVAVRVTVKTLDKIYFVIDAEKAGNYVVTVKIVLPGRQGNGDIAKCNFCLAGSYDTFATSGQTFVYASSDVLYFMPFLSGVSWMKTSFEVVITALAL